MTSPQKQGHSRDNVTPETMSSQNHLTPGTTSTTAQPADAQQPVPGVGAGPLGPPLCRCNPDTGSLLAASPTCSCAQLTPPPRTLHPAPAAVTPDSLHCRVQQVELAPALVAGPDATVTPQTLHGHRVALLKSGHFVGILAHDQAGVVLEGRTGGRGRSEQPPDIPASVSSEALLHAFAHGGSGGSVAAECCPSTRGSRETSSRGPWPLCTEASCLQGPPFLTALVP